MTLVDVFDRLSGHGVTRIDFKDGSYVVSPEPMVVRVEPTDAPAEAWIEAFTDGLVLHFNAKRDGGMQGQEEPLSNIAAVR